MGLEEIRERYRAAAEPTELGLPNRRVIAIPLGILGAVLLVLVAFGITSSSSGILQPFFSNAADERVITGQPQPIRSDEWLVQSSWTISQVEQGLPVVNETMPGGMDATVQNDLPNRDWSTAFRPHLWGFFVLPLDQAVALKWWLPGFAMIAAVFFFAVTLLPRRPILSLAIGASVFCFPFMQWWFLPITFWPPALAFLIMGSVVWSIRGTSLRSRIILAAFTGYVAVTVGMGIYVPFIVTAIYPALAFAIGTLFERSSRNEPRRIMHRLHRLSPLASAAAGALVVLAVWLLTRWETITGFLSTVYPGERLVAAGTADSGVWRSLFGGPFTLTLLGGETSSAFGPNPSEAATVTLVGIFLLVPLVVLAVRRRNRSGALDTVLIAMVALLLLVAAFFIVPGWDAIAHLLMFDRVPMGRWRLLFGIVSVVLLVLLVKRFDDWREEHGSLPSRLLPAVVSTLLFVASTAAIFFSLRSEGIPLQIGGHGKIVVLGAIAATCGLLAVSIFAFGMGWASGGALALIAVSILSVAQVNPLYRGIYDINDTELVHEMNRMQDSAQEGATWVGVGETALPNAVLMQAGLPALNGMQGAPADEMWDLIDPEDKYAEVWNRLANVTWVAGEGDPSPRNPWPDQIVLTFDSCSAVVQAHVTFVLANKPIEQSCLRSLERVQTGSAPFYLYEVESR